MHKGTQRKNMKRITIIFAIIVFITYNSYSQHKLGIEITGLRNDKGNVMLQLFDSGEQVIDSLMTPISGNKCTFSVANLPGGSYAVRYFHDENLNGKMETNMFGKPTEGYGFSNNVTGKFGPPPFKKWLFEVTGDRKLSLVPVY
jgi:uncharacterized protein (DUF2141 family)